MPDVETSPKSKPERLDARVTPEQKDLITRGAAARGQSLTDFIVSSAQAAAEEAIRTRQVLSLTARDSEALAAALLAAPAPNERLIVAARHYLDDLGRSGGPGDAAADPAVALDHADAPG